MIYGKTLLLREAAKRKPQGVSPISLHAVSLSPVSFLRSTRGEKHPFLVTFSVISQLFVQISAQFSAISISVDSSNLIQTFFQTCSNVPFCLWLFTNRLKPLSWGRYISLTPSSWSTAMGYRNGLLNGVFLNGLLNGVFLNGLLNGLSI